MEIVFIILFDEFSMIHVDAWKWSALKKHVIYGQFITIIYLLNFDCFFYIISHLINGILNSIQKTFPSFYKFFISLLFIFK